MTPSTNLLPIVHGANLSGLLSGILLSPIPKKMYKKAEIFCLTYAIVLISHVTIFWYLILARQSILSKPVFVFKIGLVFLHFGHRLSVHSFLGFLPLSTLSDPVFIFKLFEIWILVWQGSTLLSAWRNDRASIWRRIKIGKWRLPKSRTNRRGKSRKKR